MNPHSHSFEPLPTSDGDNDHDSIPPPPPRRTWKQTLFLITGVVLLLLILRNAFFNNYKDKTKDFLRSIGRTDAIDSIIPKTSQDLLLDKKAQDQMIKDLFKNMTTIQTEFKTMTNELIYLKEQNSEFKIFIENLQQQILLSPTPTAYPTLRTMIPSNNQSKEETN